MSKQPDNQNKIVLITGASSGIGQAIAFRFAKDGYQIVFTYNHNESGAEQTQKKCMQLGAASASFFHLDLLDNQSIKNTIQEIIKQYEKIDILINNAGGIVQGDLVKLSFEQIENQLRTNLEGMIKVTKECLPHIKYSIVNIGSGLGLRGKASLSVYSASKFGVRGFSQSLAMEMPELKIYAVHPGLTAIVRTDSKGMPVVKVAEIIFKAATGQYKTLSGSDINVRNYQYGEGKKNAVIFLRRLKNLIK